MKPKCPDCGKELSPIAYSLETYEQWEKVSNREGDYKCYACGKWFNAPQVKENCDHPAFEAYVAVNRLEDSKRFAADVRIRCVKCGVPFRFLGLPCGVDLNGAAVSADGTQARLAIGTHETVANIIDGNCPVGFTVRKQ